VTSVATSVMGNRGGGKKEGVGKRGASCVCVDLAACAGEDVVDAHHPVLHHLHQQRGVFVLNMLNISDQCTACDVGCLHRMQDFKSGGAWAPYLHRDGSRCEEGSIACG
jgi:hypothetical protein